jgi:hypothetical protein
LKATSIHLGENKVIGIADSSIQAKSLCYSTTFQMEIIPAMAALRNDKNFNLQFIMNYLNGCSIIKNDDFAFIEEGLEHFFNNKHISFLSVIIPTIESLLGDVFQLYNGIEVTIKKRNSHLQTTVNLTDVLKDPKVNQNLSESFISYLYYLLNDDTSTENIRNNIAHRFMGVDYYNEGRSLIVLHLLLLLAAHFPY